jgi:hypothetical protein
VKVDAGQSQDEIAQTEKSNPSIEAQVSQAITPTSLGI